MMRILRLTALLLACTLLSSCTSQPSALPEAALPQTTSGLEAPLGDAGLQREAIVPLYLPSLNGQTLLTFYETMTIPQDQHEAASVLQALFAHPGNSRVQALGSPVTLSLSGANPVEISGSVCTVNLSANALQLSNQALYTAALGITSTLCETEGIDYVNLLIAGTPLAMDVGGYLPLGLLTPPQGQELPVLWEQLTSRRTPVGELPARTPLIATAALYFPLADGSGVVCEARRISFPGQHPQQQVLALLSALSNGPDTLSGVADMPDLTAMLLFMPEITELESGGRRVTLHFTADVKERLLAASCDPACMFAAITTTLTTFVPSLQQVCVLVGDGAMTSLYSDKLGSFLFPGALMTRTEFAGTLKDQITVYVPTEQGLAAHALALPYRSTSSPRALLLEMSQPSVGALPAGLTDADLLGLTLQGDTLMVHFSARYADVLRESGLDQRLMAYSVVNTLCESLGVRRVRFFFGGEELPELGTSTAWDGEFLYNPALISH